MTFGEPQARITAREQGRGKLAKIIRIMQAFPIVQARQY